MNDENQTMIRFIDSSYRTLFFIPDGGTIIVTRSDGGKVKRACTFLDEYHTRVGRETYHICQFAKLMERVGNTYAPEQLPQLLSQCFSILPTTGEIIRIKKGKQDYEKCGFSTDDPQTNRRKADSLNARQRITPQMEAAMLGGAMKGWASPAARVSSYDVRGNPMKPARARSRKPKEADR